MKIRDLEFINFKQFVDAGIKFNPQLTVLSGRNGAGKSSVLQAVRIILSWLVARIRNENGQGQYIPQLSINNGEINGCIKASLGDDNFTVIPNKAKPGLFKDYKFEIGGIKDISNSIRQRYQKNQRTSIPVFAFYGVERAVLDIPLRIRMHEYSSFNAYDKCLEGAANFRSFFTWFRVCEDWENEQNARNNEGNSKIQHPGLKSFREALTKFMPEYTGIHVSRHPLEMRICKNEIWLNVEQLSDGEKIYLALIGDLCHRLSLANPEGNPLDGEGIVLIDEIDLHLHPQWQSEIAQRLTMTFPNIQFIVTTHSPHVINNVPTESLRMISDNGDILTSDYSYGLPSEIIFKDIMGLKHDVPEKIDSLIKDFYKFISAGNLDSAGDEIARLEDIVPEYPELVRMRKILDFKSR